MKTTFLIVAVISVCIPTVQAQELLPWTVEQVFPNATWPTLHLGAGSRVVFDRSTGLPIVAYSHYLETQYDYNLMLTYPWIMRDSFESGDLSAWSSNTTVK